jgi:hypothetical protein
VMLGMCRELGFQIEHDRSDPTIMLATLPLASLPGPATRS